MAGYSGAPLPKKLGIKPGYRIAFLDLPPGVNADLKQAIVECEIAKTGELQFAMIFVKSRTAARREFTRFARRLAPAGMLWVGWPKKTSGVATDLTEKEVRHIGLKAGLVDVKVCAVNEVWSGLKFVIRVRDR